MLQGRFAQAMEFAGIACLLLGVVALCQPFSMWIYTQGFKPLLLGWVLLTLFSHRKPVQQ
jgi:hypothetical protein